MNSRPLLLLLPTPPPFAGPEVASELLLRALRGIEGASIVHIRSNIRQDNREKGNFNLGGILAFARVYLRFLAALIRHRPGVACFLLSSNRVGFLRDSVIVLTARAFGCRVVGHYRGANFDNFYRLSSPLLRWYVRRIVRRLSGIIVQAAALKQMFDGLFPQEQISVLPNGLDFSDWPAPERAPSDRVRLLFVGHVTFAKGFYDLLLAYEQLRAKFPQLELWFAGETMDNERQKFRVAELLEPRHQEYFFGNVHEISERIKGFLAAPSNGAKYLGCVAGKEKRAAFESADIFVLPSYTEGFSMAVLEAMAYGLPVIATRVGALQEILQDGNHGFLVEPRDPQGLAATLARLIENRELRRAIGASNARLARTQYDIHHVARQLLGILRGETTTPVAP
jgi:glycosyltransferase involved in cell wall biosynthesis